MAAQSSKDRREYAANAIAEASTRADYDMDTLLDEIAAKRERLDEQQETWSEEDLVEEMENSEELGADDDEFAREVIRAQGVVGGDPEFWREVEVRIKARWEAGHIGNAMRKGAIPRARTRM